MSSIATFTPAETYADLLQVAKNGLGLSTVPGQIQDGLGNVTLMTLATDLINFDRGIGEFQIDGVALTADINTLNNLTDVADGIFLLQTPNIQLPNALQFATAPGLITTSGAGLFTIAPDGELLGLQNITGIGLVIHTAIDNYATRTLVTDATLDLTNGNGVGGNPTLGVIADTSLQRINVELNGVYQTQRAQINLIPGANMGIVVQDNPGLNSADITFSANFTQALFFKASCYAATTANLVSLYNNGVSGFGATLTNNGVLAAFSIDSVFPPLASRVLIKDQTTMAYNGIYTVTTVGNGAIAWVLTRADDFDSVPEIQPGDFTNILNGTVNANTTWVQTDIVLTIGTDTIEWQPFGFSGTVTSVTGTANRITVTNPTTTPVIDIAATYVGQTSITTLGTIATGVWNGTTITVANGGTGNTTFTAYSVICAGTTATGIFQNVVGLGSSGQVLTSAGAGALPAWATPAAGTVTSVSGTANRITSTGGATPVIDIAATYVGQTSITTLGTITTGVWNGTVITVPYGGTGLSTFTTAYGVVCAGTTATGILQNAGVGAVGQVLTSTGAASLPTWQSPTSISFDLSINQVGHALVVGDVIKCTASNTFSKAKADSAANSEVIGIVIAVADADNFTFQFGGIVTGLTVTAGTVYFLDETTAGAMTTTAPSTSGQVRKPLLIAITATTGYWMNQLGEVL